MKVRITIGLLILLGFSSCNNIKKYSITTYVTSVDSNNSYRNKKFKYLYEEFNDDSNLVYQEEFITFTNSDTTKWGDLIEKINIQYNDGQKKSSDKEYRTDSESEFQKTIDTYKYKNEKLFQIISNGKVIEEDKYNDRGQLIEIRYGFIQFYKKYQYDSKGLNSKILLFMQDTLYSQTLLYYDSNNILQEELTLNPKGEKTNRITYLRDSRGILIEEKEVRFKVWRENKNGETIQDEQVKKYQYDKDKRLIRIELYEIGTLDEIYEYEYN